MTDPFASPNYVKRFAQNIDISVKNGWYTRGKLFLESAASLLPPGASILDYGCGPGRLSLMLARAGYRVLGVDPSEEMIGEAKTLDAQGAEVEFAVGGLETLRPSSYDAIVCSSVIDYVPEPDQLFREFHNALRHPGILIMSHGNASSLWNFYWEMNRRSYNPFLSAVHQRYTSRTFRKALLMNGFEPVTRPKYFDPTLERWLGPLGYHIPFIGSLSIVAARSRDNVELK